MWRWMGGWAEPEADAKLTTDGRKKQIPLIYDIGDREYRESARTRKLQVDLARSTCTCTGTMVEARDRYVEVCNIDIIISLHVDLHLYKRDYPVCFLRCSVFIHPLISSYAEMVSRCTI